MSNLDPTPPSVTLPATDSTSRLVLLPNTDDPDPFEEYPSTDDEDDGEDDQFLPGINQLPILPLTPSVVFLYLFSPYLRLGAMYASDIWNASLAYGLTGLVVAASFSAFCRQIWFLLGRYLRRSSTEDVFIHMFARRRHRTRKHRLTRYIFTIFSGAFRLLLAAMYLRDSVDCALLLKFPKSFPSLSRLNVSVALSVAVFVLSLPRSMASKSIIYTTALSVASYLAWLVAVFRSHATLRPSPPSLDATQRGVLWNEISTFAFACTTAMTIPLSASLMAGSSSASPASRDTRAGLFQLLNVLSAMLGTLLLLPLAVIVASRRAPPAVAFSNNLVLSLRIATLVLSIPSVVVSITSTPFHGAAYRFIRTDLALSLITAIIFALNLVPPNVAHILNDLVLFLAVFGSFLLPALAHIAIHYFHRPLSIVVPQAPPSVPGTPRSSVSRRSPSPSRDPLLQRKERLLQRRRLGKRILWDIVMWVVLIPTCVGALVWAIGRLARRW